MSVNLPWWFDSFNRTLESCRAQLSETDVAEAVLALSFVKTDYENKNQNKTASPEEALTTEKAPKETAQKPYKAKQQSWDWDGRVGNYRK